MMSDDANGKTNVEDVSTKLKRSRSNSGGRSPQRNGRTERSRSRSRDRRSKEKRRHRSPGRDKNRAEHRMAFISNIPYEMRWMELKDLIREKAGDVSFVEMIEKDGKPRGSAVVEFKNKEGLTKCLDSVHRLEIGDRRLVVKEIRDPDAFFRRVREDTGMNFLASRGSSGGGGPRMMDPSSGGPVAPFGFETYGLSPTFLKQLGIEGQLCNRVFVANLPFNVSTGKIREVFSMAGRVTDVDLQLDMEGKSKGLCVVEYFHPIEAVQAISMLHHQKLYDRLLTVKMDRFEKAQDPRRPGELPVGLVNVGMGLGANGNPLTNVEQLVASGNFGPTSPFSLALSSSSDSAARRISSGLGRGGHSPPPIPLGLYDYGPPASRGGGGGGVGSLPVVDTPSGRVYTNSGAIADFAPPNSALTLQDAAPYAVFRDRERERERDRLEREFSRMPSTPDRYGLQSAAGGGGGGSSSFYDAPTRPLSPSPMASKTYGMTQTGAAGVSFGAGAASLGDAYVMRGSSDFERFSGMGGRKPTSPSPSTNTMAVGIGGGSSYAPLGGRASRTIIIRNLPLDYSWQTLRDRMRGFGEVDFADVVQPGVGKIRFKSPSDAEKATVTLHGMHVEGRPISVDLANE